MEEIYEYVRSVHGTTSAEHGIGISKAAAFKAEKADSLELMANIKKAFDPNNILNPGKLFDAPADWLTATDLRYMVAWRYCFSLRPFAIKQSMKACGKKTFYRFWEAFIMTAKILISSHYTGFGLGD